MPFLHPKTPLSTGERLERRHLLVSDTFSLTILSVITVVLALVTNAFFQSYASHQTYLSERWLTRGVSSLRQNDPQAAVYALHSALALAPGDRTIEMQLAVALASAGRLQEAAAYFNTLAESEPGEGVIEIQLARLAVREGNVAQALEYYRRAIDGDWKGDGAVRRREARLEMVGFLLDQGRSAQAKNELLVAAGNAPEDDSADLLKIGRLMEKAQSPADAFNLYKSILEHHPSLFEAVDGAGRTAFQIGHFAEAARYLQRVVSAPETAHLSDKESEDARNMLSQSQRLLLLYPSPQLSLHDRGIRILADRKIAQDRLASCLAAQSTSNEPAVSSVPAASPTGESLNPLKNFARRFEHHSVEAANSSPATSPADKLQAIQSRWKQLPAKVTLSSLANTPALASTQIQLIYDTERVTAEVCGLPTEEDDVLLLKIAQAPNAVDQE